RPNIALASVLFPQPDSPTIPNVSPLFTDKLTPLTAFTLPAFFLNTPFFIGKYTCKLCTSNNGSAITDQLLPLQHPVFHFSVLQILFSIEHKQHDAHLLFQLKTDRLLNIHLSQMGILG